MTQPRQLQFLHSTYKRLKDGPTDAVVACIKDVTTGESILKTYTDPFRNMFVVPEGRRGEFSTTKESHHMRDLDVYRVNNHSLVSELSKALGRRNYGYTDPKIVLNSPYSAGNDMPIDVLIKHNMNAQLARTASRYKTGALDIETDVVTGSKAILCISYVSDDHKVYLSILEPFLKGNIDVEKIKACCIEKVGEFVATLNKAAKAQYAKYPVTEYNIRIFKTEVEQMRWIFQMMHQEKDEFCSIWNMIYDISYMLDRLKVFNVDPADIMCHPEVPRKYRVCDLREDKTPIAKLGHHTYRWDFFSLSGYTQFIDSMCLYSRLRKVKGLQSSYTLGSIATKIIGSTKMDFGDDGHYTMQSEHPVEYCAYNIIDSLILTLHDKVTNDVSSMLLLTQDSVLPAFSKQTVQLSHAFFKYLKEKDRVPGSCSGNISLVYEKSTKKIRPMSAWLDTYNKYKLPDRIADGTLVNIDDMIDNTGGGVLNPLLNIGTGTPLLEESDEDISVSMAVSDLDVALCVATIIW